MLTKTLTDMSMFNDTYMLYSDINRKKITKQ